MKFVTFSEWIARKGFTEDFTDDYANLHYQDFQALLQRAKKSAPDIAAKAQAALARSPGNLDRIKDILAKHLAEIEGGVPSDKLPPMKTMGDMSRLPSTTKTPSDMPPNPAGEGASALPFKAARKLQSGPPTPDNTATIEPDAERANVFKLRKPNVG